MNAEKWSVESGPDTGCNASLNFGEALPDEYEDGDQEKRNGRQENRQELDGILFCSDLQIPGSFGFLDLGVGFPLQFALPSLEVFLQLGALGLENLHELALGHRPLAFLYLGQRFVQLALFLLKNLLDGFLGRLDGCGGNLPGRLDALLEFLQGAVETAPVPDLEQTFLLGELVDQVEGEGDVVDVEGELGVRSPASDVEEGIGQAIGIGDEDDVDLARLVPILHSSGNGGGEDFRIPVAGEESAFGVEPAGRAEDAPRPEVVDTG